MVELKSVILIIMITLMVIVVAVLFLGIFSMAIGGKFNQRFGNKLMRIRIFVQLLAILLLGAIMLIYKY